MAEFDVASELDVVVNEDSLGSARQQIESELGDIGVDVSASMAPTGRQPRNPRTGQFMSRRGPEQRLIEMQALDEERNDLLEELVELFDQDFTGVSGGGDGFRFRPRVRPGGGAGGLGGLGLGIAALIPLIDLLQDPNEIPVEDPGTIPVEDPGTIPVEDPGTIPVEDPEPTPTPSPEEVVEGIPGVDPNPDIDIPPTGEPEPTPTPSPEEVVEGIPGVDPNPDIDIPPTDGTGTGGGAFDPAWEEWIPRIPEDPLGAAESVLVGTGAAAAGAEGLRRVLAGRGGPGTAPSGGGGFGFPSPSIIAGRFLPGAGDLARRGGFLDGNRRQNQARSNQQRRETTVQNDVTVEVRDLGPIERSLRDLSRRLNDLESDLTGSSTGRFRP